MVGTNSAGALYDRAQTSPGAATWTNWVSQPGAGGGSVALETNTDGRVEIFGNAVFDGVITVAHRAQVSPGSTAWTDWVPLDKRTAPSPYEVACFTNQDCVTADVDADRKADLVTFVRSGPNAGDVTVSLANQNSAGDYFPPQTWGTSVCPAADTCTAADVNGDQRDDAVDLTRIGTARVALSTGTGFSAATVWSTSQCRDLGTCLLADMNHDGKDDIVDFDRSSFTAFGDGRVWVSLSDGVSAFGPPQLWSDNVCLEDQQCHLGDVNGDGFPDAVSLVTSGTGKGQAWVALNSLGHFAAPQLWTSDSRCVDDAVCAVLDYDRDGRADLLAKSPTDTADHQIWVSLSTGIALGAPAKRDPVPGGGPRIGNHRSCEQLIAHAIYMRKLARMYRLLYQINGDISYLETSYDYSEQAHKAMDEFYRNMCPVNP